MLVTTQCKECGITFSRYAKERATVKFCTQTCMQKWLHENVRSKHKAPWLRKLNQTPGRNKRIAMMGRKKNRESQIKNLEGRELKWYASYLGRHEHRVVMESILGRKLREGEIIHHKDGTKRNNRPDNLLLTTRATHARIHNCGKRRKKKGAP